MSPLNTIREVFRSLFTKSQYEIVDGYDGKNWVVGPHGPVFRSHDIDECRRFVKMNTRGF